MIIKVLYESMAEFLEKIHLQLTMIWIIAIIVFGIVMLLSRVKSMIKYQICKANVTSLDFNDYHEIKDQHNHYSNYDQELPLTKQQQNFSTNNNDENNNCDDNNNINKNNNNNNNNNQFKFDVMMNHLQYLRELHIASERCYIKRNAAKCIEITTYCQHLINAKYGIDGKTPFHRICHHRHVDLISFMLTKGADPWLKTNCDETALCLIIDSFIKHPTESSLSLICLKLLQKYGCYLDKENRWYKVYLEAAMLTNNKELIDWLFTQASMSTKFTRWTSLPLTVFSKS